MGDIEMAVCYSLDQEPANKAFYRQPGVPHVAGVDPHGRLTTMTPAGRAAHQGISNPEVFWRGLMRTS